MEFYSVINLMLNGTKVTHQKTPRGRVLWLSILHANLKCPQLCSWIVKKIKLKETLMKAVNDVRGDKLHVVL